MTLEQATRHTFNLGEEYQSKMNRYETQVNEWKEQVKTGMLGSEKVRQDTEELLSRYNQELEDEVNTVLKKVNEAVEAETKKISESREPMTQDILAELTVLSELDLTDEDVKTYEEKYSNNPLALRRLQKIANDQGMTSTISFKETKEEVLGRLDNFLKNAIESNRQLKVDGLTGGADFNWIVDSNKETIKNLLKTYQETV